ncbi:PREDICTED: uncharacterized protein LOC105558325 [Vollenhovia emeryi]|uniref:uncharacterized protein LOC105558325 n=1 Tax=Vollenhovia emeryi TaxID=411798 RepID=UPI0005F38DF4|nr:PREDICTED: uncharacterized protein LOC105558325 [Vollenhovia emeryi]
MHLVEEHYYPTSNKIVLKVLGIWPHDKSRLVFLKRVLIITLIVTYIILQLSIFITTKYNMALFSNIMSFVILFTGMGIKYCIFIFKSKTIKILHYYIQEDWKMMQSKLEIDILQKHAHSCRNYVIYIFYAVEFFVVGIIVVQFFPIILDFVSPLDEPRPRKTIVAVEYFISQDNYFYAIVFHEFTIMFLCTSVILATGTQAMLLMYHSFGMFKIACHRMEHSIDDRVLYMPNCERAIYEKIVQVVIVHRRAMEFTNIFLSSFNVPYCIFATLGVLSLSVNLFKLVQSIIIVKNIEDTFISFTTILGHLLYMFMAIYVGQQATDYNNELFKLVYSTSWYLMPITSQKLILFLLCSTGKEFYYTIGFIFVAKMENFAMLVNTALSYVAVMYSVQ